MKIKTLHWLATILILEIGLIHFFTAQHEFEEAAFLGYLFMANFLGALVGAYGIYRQQFWGWAMAFGIAAASMVGYIWSRTTGLPGLAVEDWITPWGLVSLVSECLLILLYLLRPWRMAATGDQSPPTSPWLRHSLQIAGVTMLVLVNGLAYQWDRTTINLDHGYAITTADEISRKPLTSPVELEQEYGMRIELVAISALDSIVDVRLKILDPDRAYPLLDRYVAILVDDQSLILSTHMHAHGRLKPGGIYFMFFPTENHTAQTGSKVSLVFDNLVMEPVIAR